MTVKTFERSDLKLVLDTDKVNRENPGDDTPAMVYYKGGSATYTCAVGEGEVLGRYGETIEIPERLVAWLDRLSDLVDEFLGW